MHDGAECIEIQISHSGDAARYVSTIMFTVKDPEVTRGMQARIDKAREEIKSGKCVTLKSSEDIDAYFDSL